MALTAMIFQRIFVWPLSINLSKGSRTRALASAQLPIRQGAHRVSHEGNIFLTERNKSVPTYEPLLVDPVFTLAPVFTPALRLHPTRRLP